MLKTALAGWLVTAAVGCAPAMAQDASPTLDRIKAAKTIRVAYSPDSPPFSSAAAGAAPAGYTIDLCKQVVAQIARALSAADLKVDWLPGAVAERVQMVAGGRADLDCANTTQTQTRLAAVDFSNLIFIDGGGLLVKAGAPIGIRYDDGTTAMVQQTTAPALRIGDRVRVTSTGLQLLK